MRRLHVHTSWGATLGIKVNMTVPEFIADTKARGYVCVEACYVSFPAILGVEDVELIEAVQEAGEMEIKQ